MKYRPVKYSAGQGAFPDVPSPYAGGAEKGAEPYAEGCGTGCGGVWNGLRSAVRALHGEGDDRREIRTYLEKAPENRPVERYRWLKRVAMLGGVGECVRVFLTKAPPDTIAQRLLCATALILAFDAFRLLSRVLARPSRYMLAVTMTLWAIFIRTRYEQAALLSICATVSTGMLVFMLNRRWLASETYRRTMRAKASLARVQPDEIEKYWSSTGESECIGAAYDLGALVHDPIEMWVRKACWSIGLRMGLEVAEKFQKERDEAATMRDKLLKCVEELTARLEKLVGYEKEREADKAEMERLRQKSIEDADYQRSLFRQNQTLEAKVEEMSDYISDLEPQVDALTAENARLKMELSAMADTHIVDEAPPIEPDATYDQEQIVVDLLCTVNPNTGEWYGYKAASSELGVSVWKVRDIYGKHKDEIEERRASE